VQALNARYGTDGGTPFGVPYVYFNNPNEAHCNNPVLLRCTKPAYSFLSYWNYQPTPLDNVTLRLEWYDDTGGQRTGVEAVYYDVGIGLQHWLSPQIEFRPEFTEYWASAPAFADDTRKTEGVLSGDVIFHF